MQIERRIDTQAGPQEAFDYLSDFENSTQWDPGSVSTVRRSGEGGVGTVYHNTSKFLGRKAELDYTVVQLDPGTRIKLRGENKSLIVHDTITVTPGSFGGSQVSYVADFDFRGWVKLLSPLLALGLKKLGDDAKKEMQTHLDRLPQQKS